MAWDDLDLTDTATLEGIASRVFADARTRSFDQGKITDELKASAKGLVADKLIGALGEYLGGFSDLTAFYDAVADAPAYQSMLQRALALAAVHFYAYDRRNTDGDVFHSASMKALGMLDGLMGTFQKTGKHVLPAVKTEARYATIRSLR